ncbi:MAG: DNA primase [Pseudomonadota bacterium]
MTLSPAWLDELRARTTLSAVIAPTVKLIRAGREFKACCPFHQEKTPSFTVNDDKHFYHCFGCGAHGDAIRFLTDARGLPFMDAVKELASKAGMEVPAPDPRAQERSERTSGLTEVMAKVAAWFQGQLGSTAGADARDYLKRRAISPAQIETFGIGFAPDNRGALKRALSSLGEDALVETGMLIQPDEPGKASYDRFRGRLMIPIRDARGRVIGFGGRIMGDGEPKYLNSPDTPLFDKGRTLYNLDRAGPASRTAKRLIVVEGYMDVIGLDRAGIAEVVAPNGTAVTEAQLERMWRLDPAPILCFDGDSAGKKAAVRAAERALSKIGPERTLTFALLPEGKDPDDLIREGGREAFEAILADRKPLDRLIYATAKSASDTTTPEGRAGLRQHLFDLADKIENGLARTEYRRAFNDGFFEDFGWKRNERRTIGTAIVETSAKKNPGLYNSYLRSAFYGLSRFPAVLRLAMEPVSYLRVEHKDLSPWRETLVEAVIERPDLDDDALIAILESSKLKPKTRRDIQTDLLFPWDSQPATAVRTLGGLIEFLFDEQELLAELDRVNAQAHSEMALDEYLSLDRERAALFERKAELYEFAYKLGTGELT